LAEIRRLENLAYATDRMIQEASGDDRADFLVHATTYRFSLAQRIQKLLDLPVHKCPIGVWSAKTKNPYSLN